MMEGVFHRRLTPVVMLSSRDGGKRLEVDPKNIHLTLFHRLPLPLVRLWCMLLTSVDIIGSGKTGNRRLR